jgi:folate-binding protein YgfZ
MGLTDLQVHGDGLGTAGMGGYKTGEYRGAATAARFTDPQREYSALQTSCGVYDLGFRAHISLTGSDRVRWLNGMVTNNIRDLAAGQGVYTFLLNPQGHILGDLYAYNRGDSGISGSGASGSRVSGSILVETDRNQLDKILATFNHYIIMDDVEVANLSGKITALGVAGPKAREVLQRAGIAIPNMQPLQILDATCSCDCDCVQCTVVRGESVAKETYELWLAPAEVRKSWDALLVHGAAPVGFEALELQRIAAGIPLYGVDIRERDLPQETEQARALNFNKGCYIGQEIVERIRSRGAVHRKFVGFLVDGGLQIPAGMKVVMDGKEVGEITSAAPVRVAAGEKTVALGYMRRELGVPGREVSIGTARATVIALPAQDAVPVQEDRPLEQRPA